MEDTASLLSLADRMLWITALVAAPVLLASLAIGLVIGVIQAATSVNEQTLTFVPKLAITAVVLVFFTTTCTYCRRHNARLDQLVQATRDQPLRVIGVAGDTDTAAVRDYVRQQAYRFAVTVDADHLRALLTQRRVVPLTCVIDRAGRLREVIPGEMAEADLLGLAKWARPV